MEYLSDVFEAARDGRVNRLKIYLERKCKDEIKRLIHSKTNGTTPLIMSCRNGHLEVVQFLTDQCYADIEQVGSVTFDGETIEGAPPLWCAAAAGHQNIVKYLVHRGGEVNRTTITNSTPLRAACYDGHIDIVKYLVENGADIEIANRHGHTCLMIACYKGHKDIAEYLLQVGADVNRQSVKGNTVLHDCAEAGSLEIMKMLLKHGAKMTKDAYGMSPLLAAAVAGFTKIVEYLTSGYHCPKGEKVDALELLGATYVDKQRDMIGAAQIWRNAMEMRLHNKDIHVEKPGPAKLIHAYENAVETTSLDELDDLISDPDGMRMQALLVRERILGPAHPDTSYYIRYRGALYADTGNFERCIMLWTYALDMQQGVLEALSPMTQSSFLSFAELFSFMMFEGTLRAAHPVNFIDIMGVLKRAVREMERGQDSLLLLEPQNRDLTHFHHLLVIIIHILSLTCSLQSQLNSEEDHTFKQIVYKFVHRYPRGSKGYSPLHLACARETTNIGRYPVCNFPSSDVVSLLLEVGSSVNVLDVDGNTPLHIAAMNLNTPALKRQSRQIIFRGLLNHGAHLDACNLDRKTPMQLIQGEQLHDIVSPLSYVNLQCLCARQVMASGITFKGMVSKKLEEFINLH